MHNFEFIEASAGTGKTQALAERLIALLKAGFKPQEIVALTFSRDAAGEIFQRLVELLAQKGEVKYLRDVIFTQHLSQIGTIDSFLMKMVRSFPEELGINGDMKITDSFRAEAQANKISFSILRRTDRMTTKQFVNAFALALDGDNVRSFVESYRKFIETWHEQVTRLENEHSWGDARQIWGDGCDLDIHAAEAELKAAADGVRRVARNMLENDFADWVENFRGNLSKVNGIAKKFLELDNIFDGDSIEISYRKSISFMGEQRDAIRAAFRAVFGYVLRRKLALARGIYQMVFAFEKEYDGNVRKEGKLVFADIPRLVAKLSEFDRLNLEYRMDSRCMAWALDEFQDTSHEQWQTIAPLLEEAKQSNGEKNIFIVGDKKQAIYGWRNSDVQIFENERQNPIYTCEPLVKSWRFGKAITEAINRIFVGGFIKENFPSWHSPVHETAHPERIGFVQSIEAGGKKMDDFIVPIVNALKAVDPVKRGISAAILVRSNKFGKFLADELRRHGIDGVVWEGERKVLDTPALSGFLDLVQLADHPGDMLTYRHFLRTPIAKLVENISDVAALSREFSEHFTTRGLVRVFRDLRAKMPEDANVAWSEFTEQRFNDMLEAAAEFELSDEPGIRLADFPQFLARQQKRTVAEAGKIKIMTIHRSKGLGFDYVILPLYEHQSIEAESTRPLVSDTWILPDPGSKVSRNVPILKAAYRERQDREEQEALCIYYVAMTRAKYAMTIICQPSSDNSTKVRFSDIVRASLIESEIGDREWYLKFDGVKVKSTSAAKREEPSINRKQRERVSRRLPSKKFQAGEFAGNLFVSAPRSKMAAERGIAIHGALEQIEFNEWIVQPANFTALWREVPFEVFAHGVWTSGRFDRVVFAGGKATIQDFKTGRNINPDVYIGQMTAYRKALSAMTGMPEADISLELLLTEDRKVVKVG